MTEREDQRDLQDLWYLKTRHVNEIFERAATQTGRPPAGKARYTNAPLDSSTLKVVLMHYFGRDLQISTLHTTITPSECRVTYSIDKSPNSDKNERVFIEFTQCCNPTAAEGNMKHCLSFFEGPVSEVAKPAGIGSYSLQTAGRVFWVRDTIFARVFVDYIGEVLKKPNEESISRSCPGRFHTAIRGYLERRRIRQPDISSRSIRAIIFDVAQIIDKHLAKNSVSREQQRRPSVRLLTPSSMSVNVGQPFEIELDAPDNLLEVKPAEIENSNLIVQVANGSTSGKYEFFAMGAGETKIKLLLAHALTLTVECIHVDTTIQSDPPQVSKAETAADERQPLSQDTNKLTTDTAAIQEQSSRASGGPNTSHGTGLCLLALDGRGIRGLSSLYILKGVMDKLNYERQVYNVPALKPCQVFDLIGGTSTGGLIAIMLGRLEMDVDDCISAYIELLEAFRGKLLVGRDIPEINPEGVPSAVLKSAIEEVISSYGGSQRKLVCDGANHRCKVFVLAGERTKETPYPYLRSYSSTGELDNRATIHDAALLATSPASMSNMESTLLVDRVTSEASNIWCPETRKLKTLVKCFISIGAGSPNEEVLERERTLFQSNKRSGDKDKDIQSRIVAFLDAIYEETPHFRFNLEQGLEDVGFYEDRDRDKIERATAKYLDHIKVSFLECVENLKPKPRV